MPLKFPWYPTEVLTNEASGGLVTAVFTIAGFVCGVLIGLANCRCVP